MPASINVCAALIPAHPPPTIMTSYYDANDVKISQKVRLRYYVSMNGMGHKYVSEHEWLGHNYFS